MSAREDGRDSRVRTLLDEFGGCFLHAALYADGELRVIVAEGFRAPEPEAVTLAGHVVKGLHALESSDASRLVDVRFSRPIAWQVVDESFTHWDEYEERDDKSKLQILTRSMYLDYVRASHGWFEDIRGEGKHYRVWTEGEVVDVIACEPPSVALAADL
jgi:hypothetical protein